MNSMEQFIKETQAAIEATAVNVTIFDQIEIDEVEKRARWMARRIGKITASNVPKLMTKGKGKEWGDTSIKELMAIFHERRTGIQRDSISTYAMRWGLDNERPAFEYYRDHFNPEAVYSQDSEDIVFLEPIPGFGISPDAQAPGGIIEIKNPENPVNHLMYCRIERIEKGDDYFYQMIAQFLSGCSWIDFCSFDPRMDDGDPLKMHVVRLNRVDYLADIAAVEARMIEAERYINDWDLLKNL